jgi:biopolymer transport protein ExbB
MSSTPAQGHRKSPSIARGFARLPLRIMLALGLALAGVLCGNLSRGFAQSETQTTVPAIEDSAAAPVTVTTDGPLSPATTFKGAAQNAIPTRNLFSIIREGGLAMLPLLVCSFVLLVFVFERTISLRRGRVVPGPFVTRFLQQLKEGQLDRDAAVKVCQENGSPVARVFAAAVKKWGRPAVEIEQAIIDAGERVVHELRHYLRVFNSIATIGPMLGLLGTVGGMIRAFNDIASSDAMGRPELLAKGISEALLTTATGLAVAVPAIVLYWWFVSVVDRLTVRIDGLGQDVVGVISAEALHDAAAAKQSRPNRKTAA